MKKNRIGSLGIELICFHLPLELLAKRFPMVSEKQLIVVKEAQYMYCASLTTINCFSDTIGNRFASNSKGRWKQINSIPKLPILFFFIIPFYLLAYNYP